MPNITFQDYSWTKLLNLDKKYLNAHYLRTGLVNFTQICINLIHGHDIKMIKIEDLDLIFMVTRGKETAKFRQKILKCTASSECVRDYTQTCMILKPVHDKSGYGFGYLDLIFKVALEKKVRPKPNCMRIILGADQRILPIFG